jgi:hypothetical protein
MKTRKLLLTFDYELFLGKNSGSVKKCIIEPTEIILQTLKSTKTKAIFFIDGTYLWHLSEAKVTNSIAKQDYEAIQLQLSKLYDHGHYLYLHIHPHWINATYDLELNCWNLSNKKNFAFKVLSLNEKEKVFKASFKALQEILKDRPNYVIEGFRAGGLYIQPFSDFKPFFKEFGIKYDFSVLPGFISYSELHSFDFSNILSDRSYRFDEDVTKFSEKGDYLEFPISVFNMGLIYKVINSIWYRFVLSTTDKEPIGKGSSSGNVLSIKKKGISQYLSSKETYSIELLNLIKAKMYTRNLQKIHFIHLISHPKLVSNYNLIIFDKWLSKLNLKYHLETDFKKFGF